MNGPFDSLGLSLAVAGAVIALAGVFLTPMRSVVLRTIRVRLRLRARRPAAVIKTQPEPGQAAGPAAPAPEPARLVAVAVPASKPNAAELRGGDYREQETLFARALLTAQKTADDMVRSAQAEAQEIIARAEAAAAETARASRRNASEIIQKAQQDADLIVASAKQKAAGWLALLQAEADKLAVDAHQAFQGAQRTVEQNVASLAARFERRMAEWDAAPWREQRTAPNGGGPDAPAPEPTSSRIA
jgi:vacuolar-type H+-ATPase subunit H